MCQNTENDNTEIQFSKALLEGSLSVGSQEARGWMSTVCNNTSLMDSMFVREMNVWFTIAVFLLMSPECWWYQSDWRILNNFHLPSILVTWSVLFKQEWEWICQLHVHDSRKQTTQTHNCFLLTTDVIVWWHRHWYIRPFFSPLQTSVP